MERSRSVWIKRLSPEVQPRGLWDSPRSINKARRCASLRKPIWENPARISTKNSIQIWLIFVNGLLRFKNSERIVTPAPHPLMTG